MRADWSPIARLNVPSKLAWCFLKMVVNSSPTARLDEPSNIHKEQPESVQTCVRSSPAQPCAILFHPPDPPIASNRFPSDVRFAQASTAYINGPSKLACCLPGTARMSFLLRPWREHLPQFKSELVPRARSGSTGTICVSCPPSWCARSASTGDQQPSRAPFIRTLSFSAENRYLQNTRCSHVHRESLAPHT
jgi:hypothetical protein